MIQHRTFATGLIILAAAVSLSANAESGSMSFGKRLAAPTPVKAELFSNASAIAPGQVFKVGVLFRIDPEWHIYWKNPGDAGIPTDVTLRLPEGFTAGGLQWPIPQRFEQPGGLVGYGYTGSVMLTIDVTPPAGLKVGEELLIRASASWLGCREICLVGKADLEAKVVVAAEPAPANAALFEEWSAKVPRTPSASTEALPVARMGTVAQPVPDETAVRIGITVTWTNVPDKVEFFPAPTEGVLVDKPVVETIEGKTTISLVARETVAKGGGVEGVVAFTMPDGTRKGFSVDVMPLPKGSMSPVKGPEGG